jgi:hypothetical protein
MGKFSELLDALFPEDNPEDRARTYRVLFRVIVAVHVLFAWNLFSPFGLHGFAVADEVDEKIKQAVQPVQTQLVAITGQLEMQDAVLRSIRTDQISTKIRDLVRTACESKSDAVRERMQSEIERAELEYVKLTGGRYPIPDCTRVP